MQPQKTQWNQWVRGYRKVNGINDLGSGMTMHTTPPLTLRVLPRERVVR